MMTLVVWLLTRWWRRRGPPLGPPAPPEVATPAPVERWVASRGKTRGKYLLRQELNRKGLDAAEALENRTDDDEKSACLSTAIKRVGDPPKDRSREAQAKLSAFLQRRGFGWDAIRPVLRQLYQGIVEEDLDAAEGDA